MAKTILGKGFLLVVVVVMMDFVLGLILLRINPPSRLCVGRKMFPLALNLSPTRELSCQIHDEARKFAYQTGIKVVVSYGREPINTQLRELERGVDILVVTPGQLANLLERGRVSLSMVKYLALDEVD